MLCVLFFVFCVVFLLLEEEAEGQWQPYQDEVVLAPGVFLLVSFDTRL